MSNPPNPNGANQYKICKTCNSKFGIDCFSFRKDTQKHRGQCIDCESKRKHRWYKNNFENIRANFVAKKYGLTPEEFISLYNKYNDLCAICNNKETAYDGKTGKVKSLAIDHCHKTGKVRGLLCTRCNHLIGYAKDDISILSNAIKYLKKNGKK